jgi:protocatechuate 3,4-dioxygenase beta subunit
MRSTGEPRPRLVTRALLAVAVLTIGGLWWWTHRASDGPATSTVTQSQHGSSPAARSALANPPAEPARLAVTVTDDNGPLAGATVRLAPGDGEIVVVKTGSDGTARADQLAPGTWRVSASAAKHVPAALPATQLAAGADERLAIKLSLGGRILRGTVSDATGGAIAGARIDAARLNAVAEPGDAVSTAFTGADGTYGLTVAEGALLVAAASPDYAPQSRTLDVGPEGAVADFALVPGGVIEGAVRDERTKQPIAGASVTARRDSPAMLLAEAGTHRVLSGADGRFRIGGLRPGAWEVGASAQARHTRASTIVGLGVAEQVTDVELLIGDGPVIRGRVVDDAGQPAPRVSIRAFTRGDSSEAAADAAGAFTLEGLGPGNYAITARGEGYLSSGAARVTLRDKDVDGVVVTVKHGIAVHGHVEPRQPCEIRVEVDGPPSGMFASTPTTSTAASGEFTLGPLGEGTARLSARCTSGDQGQLAVPVSSTMPDAILKVTPGGSIAGRVLDGDGAPVTGVGVMASELTSGEHMTITNGMITSGAHGLSDAQGAYRIDGLSPGSYRVTALERGKPLRARVPPPRVELAANEHKTSVDLVIERSNGVISGTVTGPDGSALADAWVSVHQDMMSMLDGLGGDGDRPGQPTSRTMTVEARSGPGDADSALPPALTDAQGHYEIRGLPRARYNVVAEARHGQLRARAADVTPDATVNLQALGVTTLSGSVFGPAGPAAVFSVELDGPTRAQRSFADGTYSFGRVDPGAYTLRVQSTEGSAEGKVTVTPNQPATLDLTLTANAVVIGKLVDATGKPVAGQAISLVPDSGDARLQLRVEGPAPTTAPDGSFRLEHRAERCALLVMRPPRPFTRRGLALEAGKTLDLGTITLPAPGPDTGAPTPRERRDSPGPLVGDRVDNPRTRARPLAPIAERAVDRR